MAAPSPVSGPSSPATPLPSPSTHKSLQDRVLDLSTAAKVWWDLPKSEKMYRAIVWLTSPFSAFFSKIEALFRSIWPANQALATPLPSVPQPMRPAPPIASEDERVEPDAPNNPPPLPSAERPIPLPSPAPDYSNDTVCMEEVTRDGRNIRNIEFDRMSEALRLAAVSQNGKNLYYIPPDLRTPIVCERAVEQNSRALEFVPPHLRTLEMCQRAVRRNPEALRFVPENFRTFEFCLSAVSSHWRAMEHVPRELPGYFDIAFTAFSRNRDSAAYMDPQTRNLLAPPEPPQIRPSRPRRASLSSPPTPQVRNNRVTLSHQAIQEHPETILQTLKRSIEQTRSFPSVSFENESGIDAGALSRQAVNEIFERLSSSERPPLGIVVQDDRAIPRLAQESDRESYEGIGAIFALAMLDHKGIRTGSCFHPLLYSLLHTLSSRDLARLSITHELSDQDGLYKDLYRVYLKKKHPSFTEDEIGRILNQENEATLPNMANATVRDFEEISQPEFRNVLGAVQAISKGINRQLQDGVWDTLKGTSPQRLAEKIEGGVVTGQNLKEKLVFEGGTPEERERVEADFKRWADQASPEKLRSFVFAMTGNSTLGRRPLKVVLGDFPAVGYHSCFGYVNWPTSITSENVPGAIEGSSSGRNFNDY